MWKQIDENNWEGQRTKAGFKVVRKPIGRGKYTYHCYRDDKYIANGSSLELVSKEVDKCQKAHPH